MNKIFKTLTLLTISACLLGSAAVSCSKIYERLDTLENKVSNLETISEYLQGVLRENKIIKEVVEEENGYTFVFTDGSSFTAVNDTPDTIDVTIQDGKVVISLSDGSEYVIPLWFATPSSITLVSSRPVSMITGATSLLPFRVNPSNATVNIRDISLDYEGANIALESVEQLIDDDNKPVPGSYCAVLKDLAAADSYEDEACLVIKSKDCRGEEFSVYSNPFTVKAVSYHGINTGLPFVILDTPNATPITSKTEWMDGATLTILNSDLTVHYQGTLSMKGRGNSTWTQFPKKPYALKLDSKAEILGMPKHKRWCLLANWMDRTLIRNDVAFELSRRIGMEWTPSGQFVELFLNGEHRGNYYLCEQIKVDENRVNIASLGKKVTEGEELTGGYLMECDLWYNEDFKFMSPVHNVPWQFKDPDEINDAQFNYMYDYVSRFEASLFESARFAAREYLDYIEPETFVDWWLVNELAQNSEINQPKSAYIYKDRGGKLKAGPVWDFDWGTFIPRDKYNYVAMGQKYYFHQLFQDKEIRSLIKTRWNNCKHNLTDIPDYIDAISSTLYASDAINSEMWPISRTTNQDESLDYRQAVERLKEAFRGKYEWLDSNIQTF
ncbi:MAG: CotH kinase family protein [Bacteroidales bacterium]|nr:CotH kinase family protein [Bacteroidales bacterium]